MPSNDRPFSFSYWLTATAILLPMLASGPAIARQRAGAGDEFITEYPSGGRRPPQPPPRPKPAAKPAVPTPSAPGPTSPPAQPPASPGVSYSPPPVADPAPTPRSTQAARGNGQIAADPPPRLGEPFTVEGTTYTPVDTLNFDQVGYAGVVGEDRRGRATALGEPFDPDSVTAASKTLPLPSYVEVTSLDTGRTILVRVNDRGPMANDRLIDLSAAAAAQLGIAGGGVAGVRVRRVNPPEQERLTLRRGEQAAERLSTPKPLLSVLSGRLSTQPRPRGPIVTAVDRPLNAAPGPADLGRVPQPATQAPPVAQPPRAPEPRPQPEPSYSGKPGVTYAPPPLSGAPLNSARATPALEANIPPPPSRQRQPDARPSVPSGDRDEGYASNRPGTSYPPPPYDGRSQPEPRYDAHPANGGAQPASGAPGGFVVQIASFSTADRANALARSLNAYVAVGTDRVWRVRYGPYPSAAAAREGLASAAARGYSDARILRNDATP